MYHCQICDTYFDAPLVRDYRDPTVDTMARFREVVCPICGQPYIENTDSCPVCGKHMPAGQIICRTCRENLKHRLCAFADQLKAEEEEQLDEWLDGRSITERSDFR